MLKKKPPKPQRDAGGCRLLSLELDFYGSGTSQKWRRFVDKGGFLDRGNEVWFCAFPDDVPSGAMYATGGFHSCVPGRENKQVHWRITFSRIPKSRPPSELVELSQAVGGYPRVMSSIGELWTGKAPTLEVTARYELEPGRFEWMRSFAPKVAESKKRFRGPKTEHVLSPVLSMVTWAAVPKLGIVEMIGLTSRKNGVTGLRLNATTTTRLSESTLLDLDQKLWDGLAIITK